MMGDEWQSRLAPIDRCCSGIWPSGDKVRDFIPIARPKKKSKQLAIDTEWTQDRIEENQTVNRICQRVCSWREGGYVGVAPTTAVLQQMAQTLEDMGKVIRDVTNHNLGFTNPCTINREEHEYHPDFIAMLDDGRGLLDALNLIVEVTGETKKEKAAKVMTARTLWVPAVNNHGAFGRWGFIEIADPWDAESTIRGSTRTCAATEKAEKRAEG